MASNAWKGIVVKPGQVWAFNGKPLYEITRIEDNMAYAKSLTSTRDSGFCYLEPDGTPKSMAQEWSLAQEANGSSAAANRDHDPGGMFCVNCQQFFPYAVPNRPSGKMACWSCRQGWIPPNL